MRKHRTYVGMVTGTTDIGTEYDAVHTFWREQNGFLYGNGQHTDAKLNISDRYEGKDNDPNGMDVIVPNILQEYTTVTDDYSQSGTTGTQVPLGFGARVEFIGFSYFMPDGTTSKNNKRFAICLSGIHDKTSIAQVTAKTRDGYTGTSEIPGWEFSTGSANCEHHRAYRERSYDGSDGGRPYQDYTIWTWSQPTNDTDGFTADWPGFSRNIILEYIIESDQSTALKQANNNRGDGQYPYQGPVEDGHNIKSNLYGDDTRYVELRLDEIKGFLENKV